jgi:hypothetical protein
MAGMEWRKGGREEEREREEQLMPWSTGALGCAYLPVILHVVAQADEAGLELLGPQSPTMVLPEPPKAGVRGWCGDQATEMGEGPGHMQRAGEDTWGRETQS